MTKIWEYAVVLAGFAGTILAGGILWGAQEEKIANIEQAMVQQAANQQAISVMQAESARTDERTRAIQESIERIEAMQMILLERTQ